MTAIPFPISSAPGIKPQEGGGRLINAYAEKQPAGARSKVIWRRSPGLADLVNAITDHAHCRGFKMVGATLIVVMDERVYAVTQSGATFSATNLGALAGTDLVTIAKNNAATPNIIAVCDAGAFNLFTNSAPTAFADSDLPAVNSVSELDGYLLFTTGSAQIWATGINNVSVASNSFTTAQGRSDGLTRGVAFRKEFFAFGPASCEVYQNIGTSPFPLTFVTMIPRGIVGTHAVAGWEEGWANELIWVADDNIVYRLTQYTPTPVSTDDVSRAIETAVLAGQGASLEASVYMSGKNALWALTNPGVWTWELNVTTGEWNERESYNRAEWRARRSVRAFNKWLVGDDTTGKLLEVRSDAYRESSDPLVWTVESGIVAQFPEWLASPRADFDMTAAVGVSSGSDPIQTDPSVLISISNGGGYSYGNPVTRKIGKEGEAQKNVTVLRCGVSKAKGKRFRLQVSDPVHVALMGGQIAVEQRAE